MTSGQLQLRGADPFALESPTTLTGTNTDGQLTDVALATPAVTTTRPVPQYETTVTITAAFSMIEPGTGSITEDGGMTVRVRLAVDLHIVVPILTGASDCRAAPIDLTLSSVGPYDGERVTLRVPNFSVPPVVVSTTCSGLLVGPVNEALAGAGHALTLTLAGDITPPTAGEPTATSLAVAPAGQARAGREVTVTATVTPDPAVAGAAPVSGVVTFFDGSTLLGTAEVDVDTGIASFATSALPAGPRELRAAYGGSPPDWDPSQSAAVSYTVFANPGVVTTAGGEVRVDGPGKGFEVTVVNTGLGGALADARLEVQIGRRAGNGAIGPNGATPRIVLSRVVDGAATAIPLTSTGSGSAQRLSGTVGDPATWLVAPGQEHTEALRLEVAAGVLVGPLNLVFTLVTGEGVAREVLATTTGVVTMVDEARQETTIAAGDPGFPPLFPSHPPVTPIVRQGNTAEVFNFQVTPVLGLVNPTGTVTFTIDGMPMLGQHISLGQPDPFTWAEIVPAVQASIYLLKVPATTPIGVRQVTVRYSGDGLYAPSQANFPITVEPAIGTVYACRDVVGVGGAQARFTANVEVQATLPSVWPAGQDLPIDRVRVRLRLSRTSMQTNVMNTVPSAPEVDRDWRLDLGPDGTINPTSLTVSNIASWEVDDLRPPDYLIDLSAGVGTISVSPTPGEPTTYTLDRIAVTAPIGSGLTGGLTCTPDVAPYTVGTVTSAGTTLAVEPGDVAGAGRDVALTATALPVAPGVVEFRDGGTTIGVVPVDGDGVATMSTTALPVGRRSLSARFFGGVGVSTPSVPVVLRVVGECPGFLDEGNGAVVRLVYLELLGRCPDAAGYGYWVDRLDGGVSPGVFARSIAGTSEAVGRVVDDAYRTMLGRRADAAGRVFWTGRLLASGRYDQLLADLGASAEFWSKAGSSDTGFVTRVYGRLLGRAPEAEGLDYWTGRLATGTSPRVLILTLANLDEPLGVLVAGSYRAILDRVPDAGERTAGIAHLRSTGDRSGLYAQLIGQPEFGDRAQGFPTP